MRRQSFHSSSVAGAKGNSQIGRVSRNTSTNKKNGDGEVKLNKLAAKPKLVHIVSQRLEEFKTHDNKYSNFTELLGDPYFLIACYDEIRGKQGNMTRGLNRETLDGINID